MTGRSLCCSPKGIKTAERALIRCSLTQKALAEDLEITRQPIGKFFTGKPVDRNLFVQICDRLDLEWEEVVAEPPSEPEVEAEQDHNIDIDVLVKEVREKIKPLIQERCDTMRVLEMTQPMGLNDIYTSVNILEKISGRRRLEIDKLLQECEYEDFDRLGLGRITQETVPGLEAVNKHSKLMILGKLGAGKTTFLKYLAIQCIGGEFHSHLVPIFITLKDFAEAANKPGLLEYITLLVGQASRLPLVKGGQDAHPRNTLLIEKLLSQGRILIILDGLDEIREEDSSQVLKEIRDFSDQYRDNHFVMTCRIAAREYTFEKFTEVEIADFDDEQIATFASNWFKDKAVKPEIFIKLLKENNRIEELAQSPLLLTLLCLVFEESGDFPANRSELYKEGLDALLKKWDAKRGIYRDQLYKKLLNQRKEDLLSKIALITFEGGNYFFKQKVAEYYITEYIRNLPDANTDPEALQLDSERILKSIEAQHGILVERAKGIYSFSHLTFHEYFTARELVVCKQSSEEALQNLVTHMMEKRWREVLFLALGMSPSADRLLLLMKEKVDGLVTADKKLQQFFMWVSQKSSSVDVPYKPGAVQAFYFESDLELDRHLNFARELARELVRARDLTRDDDCDLDLDRALSLALSHAREFDLKCALSLALDRALDYALDINLKQALQQLKEKLPNSKDSKKIQQWWQANGQAWIEQLRIVMIKYRNIGYDWQFSGQQKELLKQYYDAIKLLVDCLNSDCYVSREVRQKIEDELLLPIAEINKR
ncbi:NACHT domain-containing protein [Scytonema sp. PCC 10023]|uniref:NACHT domain-containing protein n=1 Tax=Scytonema sp. PCC 10023 TaxID=1680591 RepID=UPI0039C7578C